MTTVAATRKALAGDSMVWVESKGIWYPARKIRRLKTSIVGAAGDAGDCTRLMDWAEQGFNDKKKPKFQVEAGDEDEAILLLLNADGIHMMSTTDPYPELIARISTLSVLGVRLHMEHSILEKLYLMRWR